MARAEGAAPAPDAVEDWVRAALQRLRRARRESAGPVLALPAPPAELDAHGALDALELTFDARLPFLDLARSTAARLRETEVPARP